MRTDHEIRRVLALVDASEPLLTDWNEKQTCQEVREILRWFLSDDKDNAFVLLLQQLEALCSHGIVVHTAKIFRSGGGLGS